MPIIQQNPAWASIIGGLLGAGGNFYKAQQEAKQRKAQLDQQKQYQDWLMKHGDTQTAIDAQGKGIVKQPDGTYGPDPRIAGILGGAAAAQPSSGMPNVDSARTKGVDLSVMTPSDYQALGGPQPQGTTPGSRPGMTTLPNVTAGPNATPQGGGAQNLSADKLEAMASGAVAQAQQIAAINPNDPHIRTLYDAASAYTAQANSMRQNAKQATEDADKASLTKFRSGLNYPKNWSKMQPQQQIGYLQMRLLAAQRAGDDKTASETNAEIGRIQSGITETNRERHEHVTEGQGQQHINISLGNQAFRQSQNQSDPRAYSDVASRIRGAKTRDDAQKILDGPEGDSLTDRQYRRLQDQVNQTFGTHQETHRAPKVAKTTALDEAKAARAHGVTDDDLIVNTLVAHGYNKNAAQAAVEATEPK